MKNLRMPEHVKISSFEGKAILLDSRNNMYYCLNESALEFLDIFSNVQSFEQAVEDFVKKYEGVSIEQIKQDMRDLFTELINAGLLEHF